MEGNSWVNAKTDIACDILHLLPEVWYGSGPDCELYTANNLDAYTARKTSHD
jgi:hypothetical protein